MGSVWVDLSAITGGAGVGAADTAVRLPAEGEGWGNTVRRADRTCELHEKQCMSFVSCEEGGGFEENLKEIGM